jgi:hypothetical protein
LLAWLDLAFIVQQAGHSEALSCRAFAELVDVHLFSCEKEEGGTKGGLRHFTCEIIL